MANMAAVKGYIVAAAKADHSSELTLYVTTDTETWHHAEFGDHKVEQDAYTILESTNYSIQVDVMTSKYTAMGTLYTSNSNGTYFTKNVEHMNRNERGFVDFEKIANIQGVVMINVVDNWEDYEKKGSGKKLKSKISFDDGRTFKKLRIKGKDDKELHLLVTLSLALALIAGNLSPAGAALVCFGVALASALREANLIGGLTFLVLARTTGCEVDVTFVISDRIAVAGLEVWGRVLEWFGDEAVGVPLAPLEQLLMAHNTAWLAIIFLPNRPFFEVLLFTLTLM